MLCETPPQLQRSPPSTPREPSQLPVLLGDERRPEEHPVDEHHAPLDTPLAPLVQLKHVPVVQDLQGQAVAQCTISPGLAGAGAGSSTMCVCVCVWTQRGWEAVPNGIERRPQWSRQACLAVAVSCSSQ